MLEQAALNPSKKGSQYAQPHRATKAATDPFGEQPRLFSLQLLEAVLTGILALLMLILAAKCNHRAGAGVHEQPEAEVLKPGEAAEMTLQGAQPPVVAEGMTRFEGPTHRRGR
ncbi:MAG: hypothetical protein R3C53_27095 [Pirellulaceae bacterium]